MTTTQPDFDYVSRSSMARELGVPRSTLRQWAGTRAPVTGHYEFYTFWCFGLLVWAADCHRCRSWGVRSPNADLRHRATIRHRAGECVRRG